MAEFNTQYYQGTDQYSDGDIEEEILSIVKAGKSLEESGSRSFPVLYHLSVVRENILSWYDFRKGASVLEIGAGPGAITGLLCRRCAQVTSVELSERRARINYERHKEYENLKVMVGNLNDMQFPGKFDYVILNGVFEYAGSFTDGPDPYGSFLKRCAGYLKEDGLLLIAIENRLGLKYFAGAPEDHTDNYMEGLKNYPDNSSVHTFSRQEWEEMCDRCGLSSRRFYYPYPDYKFPNEIFTSKTLRADGFGRNAWNFNPRRLELFSEQAMGETLCREGVMECFMNSFLIEAGRGKPAVPGESDPDGAVKESDPDGAVKASDPDGAVKGSDPDGAVKASDPDGAVKASDPDSADGEIIYAKISADRAQKFRIQTVIREKADGSRTVVKSPLTQEAAGHIRQMNERERADSEMAAASETAAVSETGVVSETGAVSETAAASETAAVSETEMVSGTAAASETEMVSETGVVSETAAASEVSYRKKNRPALLPGVMQTDGSVRYPFLKGKNLAEMIEADADSIRNAVLGLQDLIRLGGHKKEGDPKGFTELFGRARLECSEEGAALEMVSPANIDLIFDNIFPVDDRYYVIDGEWITDVPVPVSFILWRAVNELYSSRRELEKALPQAKLLKEFGITAEDRQVYWKWASHFEKNYVQANRLGDYARTCRKVDLKDLQWSGEDVRLTATLYLDRGRGWNEEDSVHAEVVIESGTYDASFEIERPEEVQAMRFDPLEGSACVCALRSEQAQLKPMNASAIMHGANVFLTLDPAYKVICRHAPSHLRITGTVKTKDIHWALEKSQELLKRARLTPAGNLARRIVKRIKK